jgi:hemolysin III
MLVAVDAYGPRPLWRGRVHLVAAALAVPAVLLLVTLTDPGTARLATAVYGVTLVGLFAVSASYHRLARTPTSVKWMRRADHSMIFLLIAGTYTPICLLALPRRWGVPFLLLVWAAALVGVGLKMARLGTSAGSAGSWLYIVIGWAAIMMAPLLVTSMSAAQLLLLGFGGILYTVGAVVLARRWPDPWPSRFGYHEVWHAMTVGAGGLHFVAILSVVGAAS